MWPPAAASSSARRARSCPRTSARSGWAGRGRVAEGAGLVRRRLGLAPKVRRRLGEMLDWYRLDAGESGLGRRLGGAEHPLEARPPRSLGGGEDATHRPNPAVEGELADCRVGRQELGRDLVRGTEDGERDRKVEAGALLAEVGRREVHRDAARRPEELRRGDAAAHAMLRLLAGPVGEADDREHRLTELDVRLHLHAPRVEADERVGEHAGEHKRIEAASPSHVCVGTATIRAVHADDEALHPGSHDDRVPMSAALAKGAGPGRACTRKARRLRTPDPWTDALRTPRAWQR